MNIPIIIDNSYAVYFIASAAWTWHGYEFGHENIPTDGSFDPMTDNEFKAMYKRKFLTRIHNAIKDHIVFFNKSDLIFAKDCHRKNIWRKEVFPEYKMMREANKKKKPFDWSGIYNYTNNIILPTLQEEFGARVIEQRHSEGDDVIAVLVNELSKKYKEIILVASDGDLVQLADKCRIVTLKGEEKTPESVMAKYKFKGKDDDIEWTIDNYLRHKTIMGDGSDEIPPIIPGSGPVRTLKYINNSNMLIEAIAKDPQVGVNLKRNDTLINLKNIPQEIQEEILTSWYENKPDDINDL